MGKRDTCQAAGHRNTSGSTDRNRKQQTDPAQSVGHLRPDRSKTEKEKKVLDKKIKIC